MPIVEIKGKKIEISEEGFMIHPEEWDKEIAEFLAKIEEGLDELTEAHWSVINYIRNYYLENKIVPMIRLICKNTGFNLKQIYDLFPSGPSKGAAKIAGLPKPDGCV